MNEKMKKKDLEDVLESVKSSATLIEALYNEVSDTKASENLEDWHLANNLQGMLWHIRFLERHAGQAIELFRMRGEQRR